RTSASGASATRIPAPPRRRCCSRCSRRPSPRPAPPPPQPPRPDRPLAGAPLVGRPGSPGVGVGRLLWVDTEPAVAPSSPAHDTRVAATARNAAAERARLDSALAAAAPELTALAAEATKRAGEDVGAIFDAQALFASDPGIVEP